MTSLKFGTSGLRGLVTELPDSVCAAYTRAFLTHLIGAHGVKAGMRLLIGYDLRDSSPRMAAACMSAAAALGMDIENCGPLPTPALAARALGLRAPAIMVTGSHIPADRNGLKFYRPDGEIDKADEAGIIAALPQDGAADEPPVAASADRPVDPSALDAYRARCASILAAGSLDGRRIGVYQHSAVGRDLLADVLGALGADVVTLGRSDSFIPIDTEALRAEDIEFALRACREEKLDALVSTDGDADRPLVADETGTFLRGDTLGLLTAHHVGADAVVTPVTSNTAIEQSHLFQKVYRTKVGSPFVIEGMQLAAANGCKRIVGFEANGGVLLGSAIASDTGTIAALPTRDAMLPILAVLGMAAGQGQPVSALAASLPARFTRSGRIEHVDAARSTPFLDSLTGEAVRNAFFADLGPVEDHDCIDGVRVVLESGEVVHYRASGNAPELRCYAEAASGARADELLNWGLARAAGAIA